MLKSKKNYRLSTRYKKQSQRQLRVSQLIHSSLIECFKREGRIDLRLANAPINIIEVNISPDLRIANCFFTPFNTSLNADELLDALDKSIYVIRGYVTRKINLKYSPEIRFFLDENSQNADLIEKILFKV